KVALIEGHEQGQGQGQRHGHGHGLGHRRWASRSESSVGAGTEKDEESGSDFVHISIFPGEGFAFVERCYIMALAESAERAGSIIAALLQSDDLSNDQRPREKHRPKPGIPTSTVRDR
ncbi:unnamed protein product, partial [Discosporangium mesarthrocarpum]